MNAENTTWHWRIFTPLPKGVTPTCSAAQSCKCCPKRPWNVPRLNSRSILLLFAGPCDLEQAMSLLWPLLCSPIKCGHESQLIPLYVCIKLCLMAPAIINCLTIIKSYWNQILLLGPNSLYWFIEFLIISINISTLLQITTNHTDMAISWLYSSTEKNLYLAGGSKPTKILFNSFWKQIFTKLAGRDMILPWVLLLS